MNIGKCGCGREAKYMVGELFACNKYIRCPSYEELSKTAKDRWRQIFELQELLTRIIESKILNSNEKGQLFKSEIEKLLGGNPIESN
jgi:hypothetical protein